MEKNISFQTICRSNRLQETITEFSVVVAAAAGVGGGGECWGDGLH